MIGKEILNYHITGIIGKGGMGTVYIAVNKYIQEQQVAIKVINHDMLNDFTRKKLEEEAHRLASLKHPNIVQLVNFHKDEEGSVYLIMEYVEGVSIEKYLNKVNGLVVEDRICPIFEPILDGIGFAHKHKGENGEKDPIIHCDIKPANIVLSTDEVPHVKILDFGIAQIVSEQEEHARLIMGTPSFMSPEQVRGEKLDARSDIYSLGVLLHQMLTGHAPYDTTTLTEQQIQEKVVEEPLPRIATFYKYVSEKVQQVVDKATAKNPDDRYQTCEEFKNALHKAIYPHPPLPKWAKGAIVATVALLIGLGSYVWDYSRVKTFYYKDYVEQWGVPQGFGKLSNNEHSHAHRSYKFVYQKRKLLQVSHVNSFDKLIDDGESERIDRPVDQLFFYTDEGKVSRVQAKNRSGKVLYIKSYNDKLNVMAFQYDDEHNTERVMSNSTDGYNRREDVDQKRGRISRWWIEYDENGYVLSEKFHTLDNSPVGDDNGIYGRTYVRDEKGRPIEIHYIGMDGKPCPTRWGLGIKTFEYDENDNWIKSCYLTVDRKPARDASDGVFIYQMEYDKYGNCTSAYHLDGDGSPMIPKMNNVAGVRNTYDERGLLLQAAYLGLDGTPMFVKNQGVAIIKYEYDDNGYLAKQIYCDPDGNVTEHTDGNAMVEILNNEFGDPVELWYKDAKGELCALREGYAGCKVEYDSVGNVNKQVFYGVDKAPALNREGVTGYISTYDDRGLQISLTYLGRDLEPAKNHDGVVNIRFQYDKRGNTTQVAYYGIDGDGLENDCEGIAGWRCSYDENGNVTERYYFDENEHIVVYHSVGYAKVLFGYDENGNLNKIRYFGSDGQLRLNSEGLAGYDYINDKRGNTLEEKPVGLDNELAYNRLECKYKYDESYNCIEQSLYNRSGATTNQFGVHKYEYVYDSHNQLIEERHYDTRGRLTICQDETQCAIQRNMFDDKGNRIKTEYFGVDGKPTYCGEGWSSATYEYNAFGGVIKQCFFGIDGKPTDARIMPPVGVAEYDKWGNVIYIAAYDENGNLIINPQKGWSFMKGEYDVKGNVLWISYFNEKEKPMLCKEGYHKVVYTYTNSNKQETVSYFDVLEKPMLVNGCHKEQYKYDENDLLIEISYWGITGKPVDVSAGFSKLVCTYDKDHNPQELIYYSASGKKLLHQRYVNGSWVAVSNGQGNVPSQQEGSSSWRDNVTAFDDELPVDLGDDADNIVIQSAKIINSSKVELIIVAPKSKYDMAEATINLYTEVLSEIVTTVKQELKIPRNVVVKGILKDSKGRVLSSVNK